MGWAGPQRPGPEGCGATSGALENRRAPFVAVVVYLTYGIGLNAIAEDCEIEKWWREQEYVTAAREANYV